MGGGGPNRVVLVVIVDARGSTSVGADGVLFRRGGRGDGVRLPACPFSIADGLSRKTDLGVFVG